MMSYKILVVDDFIPVRDMYVAMLERFGYTPLVAETGEQALRMIYGEQPDLILLDVDLPGPNGLEILQRLRSNARTQEMRVIMITGNHNVEHSQGISEADLLLIKPVSPTDLANFVQRLLPEVHNS